MFERTALFAESWNVAWRKINRESILTDKITPFAIIKNSFRYWAADPFYLSMKISFIFLQSFMII